MTMLDSFSLRQAGRSATIALGMICGLNACSLSSLVDVGKQTGQTDPNYVNSLAGANALFAGAIRQLQVAYAGVDQAANVNVIPTYAGLTGLFSDELHATRFTASGDYEAIDARNPDNLDQRGAVGSVYTLVQQMRRQAQQAAAAMAKYKAIAPDRIGYMYAVQGYAELMLAEAYCSGIPLSNVPAGGGAVQYSPGLTTTDVLNQAIAHFDSAVALTADTLKYRQLAYIGKARALMDLGQYTTAANLVKDIPSNYAFNVEYQNAAGTVVNAFVSPTVGIFNNEGGSALSWVSDQDPRVKRVDSLGASLARPFATLSTPIPLASGIEAQLIMAEAALSTGSGSWLTILNDLRSQSTVGVLPPLVDPGTDSSRVDLLFKERAYWMFGTGHRLGDLRRLVRQYRRSILSVYPNGQYLSPSTTTPAFYGTATVLPVPRSEREANGQYLGCANVNP